MACNLQINADPDPAYHFDADPYDFFSAYILFDSTVLYSIRYASGAGLRIHYRRYPEKSYDLFAKVKMSKCGEIGTGLRAVYWELTRYGMEDERGLT